MSRRPKPRTREEHREHTRALFLAPLEVVLAQVKPAPEGGK